MAKKYKYSFTRKNEAKGGKEALVLAGISFAAFLVLIIVSFAFSETRAISECGRTLRYDSGCLRLLSGP